MPRRQAAQNLAPEAVSCAAPSQADPEAQLPAYPGNSSDLSGNLSDLGNPGNQPLPSAPIDQNTQHTRGTRVVGDRSDSEIDSPPSYDAAMRGEV